MYKLVNLIDIISGGTPKTKVIKYWDGEIPWISIADFTNSKYIEITEKKISIEGIKNSNASLSREDDILISARGTVGKLTMLKQNFSFNQSCFSLRSKDTNLLDQHYLFYFLVSYVEAISKSVHGSVFNTINKKTFETFRIDLPPLSKQKEIADILSSFDDKIENNNKIINTLENISSVLYDRWFVEFEFPDENGLPYKSSGGKMVSSELGMIPVGWEVKSFEENKNINLIKPGVEKFDGQLKYVATADIEGHNLPHNYTYVAYDGRPTRANMQPKENSIWLAKMKDSFKHSIIKNSNLDYYKNFILSTGFLGVRCDDVAINYFWQIFNSKEFMDQKNNLSNGTTMQAINNKNFLAIKTIIPTNSDLMKFNEVTNPIIESILSLKTENEKLMKTRDVLIEELIK